MAPPSAPWRRRVSRRARRERPGGDRSGGTSLTARIGNGWSGGKGATSSRPTEQLPASLRLGIRLVPDLVPHRIGAVRVRLPLGYDPLEIEPLRRSQHVAAASLDGEDLAQGRAGGLHDSLECPLAAGQRQPAQISSAHPQGIEGGVMEIASAFQQGAKILPPLRVERHDLAVQDRLLHRQLLTDPVAEILKSAEHVAALGAKVTVATGDVEEAAEAVVLGLEDPRRVVERSLQP